MLDDLGLGDIIVEDRRATLFLGSGPLALEVVVAAWSGCPRIADLRVLFRARAGRRATPILIVAPWGSARVGVCGPTEHNAIEHRDLPADLVEAVCGKALETDGRHAAIQILHRLLPQLDAPSPVSATGGSSRCRNSNAECRRGRTEDLRAERRGVRPLRGRTLIQGLGFAAEEIPGPAMLLLAGDRKTAVAVLLDRPR